MKYKDPIHTTAIISSLLSIYSCVLAVSTDSHISSDSGHYPHRLCRITNAFLNSTDGVFYAKSNQKALDDSCQISMQVWDIKAKPDLEEPKCDLFYDEGYIFTIFYWFGTSNYYHLHYDMMIPIFRVLYYEGNTAASTTKVLMPTVESSRLQVRLHGFSQS